MNVYLFVVPNKKKKLWKRSFMILNGSWKWEKDKCKKRSVKEKRGRNWISPYCKKSTVTPSPLFLSDSTCTCLLLDSRRQRKQWHLPFDWHTEHIGAMNELSPCRCLYIQYRVLLAEFHFVERMNGWHRFSITCHHRNKGLILCSVFQFILASTNV